MHALMNTHSTAGNHHSLLLSLVAGFNNMLKSKALAMIHQSNDRVVKAIFENMLRVLADRGFLEMVIFSTDTPASAS